MDTVTRVQMLDETSSISHHAITLGKVYIFTNPSTLARYDSRSRTPFALLLTHCWRESNWIHTFPKGISAM